VGNLWLTPIEIEGVMALASIKSEKNYFVGGFNTQFEPIASLRKSTSFKNATKFYNGSFGGTDASSAYSYAMKNAIQADVFVFFTDSESWAGRTHTSQALTDYRKKFNPKAKAIYVTLVPNGDHTTLVDPKDKNSYDVAGFTAETPKLIQMIATDQL
jgi:60 kDa SS-A/Ro ribonucleoprotein